MAWSMCLGPINGYEFSLGAVGWRLLVGGDDLRPHRAVLRLKKAWLSLSDLAESP